MENSPTKCNINPKKTNLNENDQITNLNTQISLLRTQKTQLEDQIHAQSQQIKNLNQKMFQLQKTFAENRFNSEQDYSLYVKTEKELKQSNESLKSENELLKNEKKIIQISYNQLKDQYSKLKKKQEEQESYYDHLSKNMDLKLSEVTEERDNLFFELSQKKDSEKAFNEFKSVINDLKIQNQKLFDKNGSLTETIERISKENEQLRSQLDSAYNNNNSFFNLLESENSIQKLQDTIENDSLRESALVLSLEKAENTIKKLESQNLSLKNEIENLQKSLPSELVNIKKQYNESQDLISNLNERISNMTLQISAIRQENKRLKKRLQASEQRNTNLELDQLTSMPALQNKIKELEKSSNEQQQTIKTMKELQLKIEEENDQLKLKNSQLSIQNDQLIKEKNDINLRFDPDTAKKVQKLLKKLNQLQYDFFHEDEGLFKHYTERQYRDIIITLKQQLEDAQRTKNLLLKERNEYRKNLNEQLVKQANVV
ncbi:hypothetical protein M9Y10_025681 [Tritrichomonas musculus]|uniref:Uncharacterized protein n=1 Tax=Tritrichomonas musculus TaxID=1915356 RepID=A0ABR2H9B9_9EUKA